MGEMTLKEAIDDGWALEIPAIYDRLVALVEEEMQHSEFTTLPTFTGANWAYMEHVPEKCIRCRFAAILGTAALDKETNESKGDQVSFETWKDSVTTVRDLSGVAESWAKIAWEAAQAELRAVMKCGHPKAGWISAEEQAKTRTMCTADIMSRGPTPIMWGYCISCAELDKVKAERDKLEKELEPKPDCLCHHGRICWQHHRLSQQRRAAQQETK